MKIFIVLFFIFIFILPCKASDKIPEDVLKRRYGEFSTAGAFILLSVKNESTKETATIICENTDWYITLVQNKIYDFHSDKEYTDFMMKNYNKEFSLPDKIYKEFVENFGAKSVNEFQEARAKGLDYVVKTYLKKYEWSPGGHVDYVIENKKLSRDRSFIKILLELGLVVRRDCESGMIYIESREIKN